MGEWNFARGLKGFQPMPTGLTYDSKPFRDAYQLMYQQALQAAPYPGTTTKRISVPGYQGDPIGCFVLEPDGCQEGTPAIVYFHGGGMVAGVGMTNLQVGGWLAAHLGCRVFLPEYRTTFQKKYPCQPMDCYEAARYLSGHHDQHGIAPALFLYGDSSGGCLAAAVAQMARDRGTIPLRCQMLIYPCLDYRTAGESYQTYANAAVSTEFIRWSWKFYLEGLTGPVPAYASPLYAADFSRLPDAYIEAHEVDCLRDDGLSYARKLQDAGVFVDCERIPGSYHGVEAEFDTDFVQALLEKRAAFLRRYFQ
ncbi:MAG: alpha/beta hydrolase [Lachnospiraceae bacterium]